MEVESVVFQRPAGDKRDFWVQCAETVTVLDRQGRREEVHVRFWHKADMAARAISAHNPLGHLLSAIRLSVPAAYVAPRTPSRTPNRHLLYLAPFSVLFAAPLGPNFLSNRRLVLENVALRW
jgi:hypothetical protein